MKSVEHQSSRQFSLQFKSRESKVVKRRKWGYMKGSKNGISLRMSKNGYNRIEKEVLILEKICMVLKVGVKPLRRLHFLQS